MRVDQILPLFFLFVYVACLYQCMRLTGVCIEKEKRETNWLAVRCHASARSAPLCMWMQWGACS